MIPAQIYSLAPFFALAAFVKWKYRRGAAQRRINRSLRTYTASLEPARA
jgi:hypothetical protein